MAVTLSQKILALLLPKLMSARPMMLAWNAGQ
jgi:hypothetical protein